MRIKLSTFDIVDYDSNNVNHRNFKYLLLNDNEFCKFFGKTFVNKIDEIFIKSDSNNLEIKKAYLIEQNNDIIGMIRLFDKRDSLMVNLQYTVNPNYRNMGYGKKILEEISCYFNQKGIYIDLDIDKNNYSSLKCALANDYEVVKKNDNTTIRYRRK